jgi:hypothetical protein
VLTNIALPNYARLPIMAQSPWDPIGYESGDPNLFEFVYSNPAAGGDPYGLATSYWNHPGTDWPINIPLVHGITLNGTVKVRNVIGHLSTADIICPAGDQGTRVTAGFVAHVTAHVAATKAFEWYELVGRVASASATLFASIDANLHFTLRSDNCASRFPTIIKICARGIKFTVGGRASADLNCKVCKGGASIAGALSVGADVCLDFDTSRVLIVGLSFENVQFLGGGIVAGAWFESGRAGIQWGRSKCLVGDCSNLILRP